MKTQILCLLPLDDQQKEQLIQTAGKECELTFASIKTVTWEQAQAAQIIFGNIPHDMIKDSVNLKWLQLNSSGADNYTGLNRLPDGVLLTSATGAYGQSVGEHSFAVMLMMMKNLHLYRDNQAKSLWADCGMVTTPVGSRILIVGFGDIGTHFAKLCKATGAYVIGVKRTAAACPECLDQLITPDKLDAELAQADVVLSILPGTKANDGFWNERRFAAMKKTAMFINVGRGSSVVQEDLYKALYTNTICCASIDVTTPEPLPLKSKLWKLPNLVLTPHIAGSYHLSQTLCNILDICCKNLTRYQAGQPLCNRIDVKSGNRLAE